MNAFGEQMIEFQYTWKLKNHYLLNPFHHKSVKSPEFKIPRLPEIKWCIGYYPPKFVFDNLSVFLLRSDDDNGPIIIEMAYNVAILNENGIVAGISETSRTSFQRSHFKIYTINLIEGKQLNNSRFFTLRCNFFVNNEPIGIELQEDTNILSRDIKTLLENEVICDVTLKQPDCQFKAHKCILWARCPELLTLQNSEEESKVSGTFKIKPNELKSLLNDVYSGRLDTFKSDTLLIPAVRKYELILQGKESLSSLCVYSNVQKHSVSQIWSFNVKQLSVEKKIYTPVLAIKGNEFKLAVQLTNHSGEEKMQSCLRCVSTETLDSVYLHYDIKLLGAKENFHISSSHLFCSGENYIIPWDLSAIILKTNVVLPQSHVNYHIFANEHSFENYCNYNLQYTLSVSDGNVHCISELWNAKLLSVEIDNKILSKDLLNLYKSKKFSDLNLVVGEKSFSVHKSILAARSPVFSRMFQANMVEFVNNEVTITDTQSKSMETLLEYLYAGRAILQNVADVMQLYTAADKYEVFNLKQICATYLESKFDTKNATEILILADMHRDKKLKGSAQTFISENAEEILVSDEWKNIIMERIDLAVEVMHRLSLEDREKKRTISNTVSQNVLSSFGAFQPSRYFGTSCDRRTFRKAKRTILN